MYLKNKLICGIAVCVLSNSLALTFASAIYAEEIETSSQTVEASKTMLPLNTYRNSDTKLSLESIASAYKEVDIEAKNYDRSLMSDEESKLLDIVLDNTYQNAFSQNNTLGYSEEQFKILLENVLKNGTTAIAENDSMRIMARSEISLNGHGVISTTVLGWAIDAAYTTFCVISGFGTQVAMLKQMGKEYVKNWLINTVVPKIVDLCASKFGLVIAGSTVFVTSFAAKALEWLTDFGAHAVNYLDSIDKIPNNGYLEWS